MNIINFASVQTWGEPCHELGGSCARAWLQARALDNTDPGACGQQITSHRPCAREAYRSCRGAEQPGALAFRASVRDGSARLLVELADGQTVESVLLPRDGVCVSTQVGYAVGCLFCA